MSHQAEYCKLPHLLNAKTEPQYKAQARALYNSPEANNARHVVYKWVVHKCIPRLKGKSKIIYIGSTLTSLKRRHAKYAGRPNSRMNWLIFKHVLKHYGAVQIHYSSVGDPRLFEQKELLQYLKRHLEYPPLNRVSAKR
jgi:hypothetical protein